MDDVEVDGEFLWPRQQRKDGKFFGFTPQVLAKKKAVYEASGAITQFFAQYYNDPNDKSTAPIARDLFKYFKKEELDDHAREMYRVVKPGARYACSEYLLTPHFDWNNEEHVTLHKTFLPTLAATQSMYPADVCAALESAGFKILISAPSKGEAWPICEQKSNLVAMGRKVVRALEAIRVLPPWVEESLDLLQTGGQAWTDAEKAKIADLNWRIVAEKPLV